MTEGQLEGSSQPASSHVAIAAGGWGGEVRVGRCTFKTNPAELVSSFWESAALVFAEADLEAPRLTEGWSGRSCNQRLQSCSRIWRLAGLRCWLRASR